MAEDFYIVKHDKTGQVRLVALDGHELSDRERPYYIEPGIYNLIRKVGM